MRGKGLGLVLGATLAIAPLGAALADSGGDTFKAKCAVCHGADGKGQTTMGKKLQIRDLADPAIQGKKDDELAKTVSDGNAAKKMPAFKDRLTPDLIKAVVQFVRTFKK